MSTPDFDAFSRLVRERSGLVLTPDKVYLVKSRLEPIARDTGHADYEALLVTLRKGAPEPLVRRCIDAMATHESFFFRDGTPFDNLAGKVLPPLIAARQAAKSLRIWCAACSSGQEPYSIAMILQEMSGRLNGWNVEIVATDMSEPILQKARAGVYTAFEVKRGLSPERLNRWFKPKGADWQVSPTLQQMVQFRPHNLLHGTAAMGVFDVVFCRNVLIYLDVEKKRQVLDQIGRALQPDGALFLGSAETMVGVTTAFEPVPTASGLYRRAPSSLQKIA